AAGASLPVQASFTAGHAGSTGQVKVTASLTNTPAVRDSGWVAITATSATVNAVAAAPHGASRAILPGTVTSPVFWFQNTGTASASYDVTGTCTGPAFASSCALSSTRITLAAGAYASVTATSTAGAAGMSGHITLTARM